MNLYHGRNKIIKLFEDKNIIRSNYALDAKFEPEESDGVEESEQEFDETIGERRKMIRQKHDKLNKMIIEKDEIINRDLFKKYFLFHSLSDMQKNCLKHRMHKKIKNL